MYPLEMILKYYNPAIEPGQPLAVEEALKEYPGALEFINAVVREFGPCDITAIEETKAEPPGAVVLLKLVYAYNRYAERIKKAEEYFKTAPPEQSIKYEAPYNELIGKAGTALNGINDLKKTVEDYDIEFTPGGLIKVYSRSGKEINIKIAA